MPPALLIIADDLTGANDTGVQFAKRGIRVLVSIHHEHPLENFAHDCQVLVVNTESRHLTPAEAYRRVAAVAHAGVALGIPQFYKKTDSTLRGNIGAELAALLDATGESALFFAPAYPKLNRTTQQGTQFVNGIPLSQSAFAADVRNPLRQDFIPALLAQQTNRAVKLFDQLPVAESQPTIYVLDAQTDEDLRRSAQLLAGKSLLAGSAGLAEFLAESMQAITTPAPMPTLSSPVLVVNGSMHETSLRQVEHAAQRGWQRFALASEPSVSQVVDTLATARRALLTTSPEIVEEQAAMRLANFVHQVVRQISVPTLIVFGGDTLAAIAEACGWTAFCPQTEFLPGVPFVKVCGRAEVELLTKAGGFGGVDLIQVVAEARL